MSNHNNGEIRPIPQEHIDAAKKGASGGLGLIGGVAKGIVKAAGAFANTAKQYANLARGAKAAKKTSNFRPLIINNQPYNRKMINDAFAQRFGKPQNVIKKATESKDALTHLKKVKTMANNAGPKNSVKSLTESAKKRTNFRSK